jgi:hypothetical protein
LTAIFRILAGIGIFKFLTNLKILKKRKEFEIQERLMNIENPEKTNEDIDEKKIKEKFNSFISDINLNLNLNLKSNSNSNNNQSKIRKTSNTFNMQNSIDNDIWNKVKVKIK